MSNCVETYAGKCWSGGTHIFSVRDAAGKSLSTAEVKLVRHRAGGGITVSVVQHEGARGNQPSRQCAEALKQLIINFDREPYSSRLWMLYVASLRNRSPQGLRANIDNTKAMIDAFRQTLSGKWAFDTLVDEVLLSVGPKNELANCSETKLRNL